MTGCLASSSWPDRIHSGYGAAGLVGQEAQNLGVTRTFIVVDPGTQAAGLLEPITESLEAFSRQYVCYDTVVPNPDTDSIDAAGAAYRDSGADCIVGIGGGSALDTAKAVRVLTAEPAGVRIGDYLSSRKSNRPLPAARKMPPMIAVPTTAGTGSEATPWSLITDLENQVKTGIGNQDLIPTVALADPALTLTLPPFLTAATGMDALSHCIEAYVSTNDHPMLDPMILSGIELIGKSLRIAVAQGDNEQARADLMLASLIGGIGIAAKQLGACHSLAHPLSSLANVQHGLANALMLPYQMEYSLPGALERYARIGKALDGPYQQADTLRQRALGAVEAVRLLSQDTGLPPRLSEAGVTQEQIGPLGKAAHADLNWMSNPRPVSEEILTELFFQAY